MEKNVLYLKNQLFFPSGVHYDSLVGGIEDARFDQNVLLVYL